MGPPSPQEMPPVLSLGRPCCLPGNRPYNPHFLVPWLFMALDTNSWTFEDHLALLPAPSRPPNSKTKSVGIPFPNEATVLL